MSIGSWFMLGLISTMFGLNIYLAIKIAYQDHKIKKLEKKSKKNLDNKK